MHQWWGDSVTEGNYNLTFFKEGMATLGEYLFDARNAATAAGGLDTPAGQAAFDASLVDQFNTELRQQRRALDSRAVGPDAGHACSRGRSPTRGPAPPTSRCARSSARTTSPRRCSRSSATTGGSSITEKQLEAEFHALLPNQSAACQRPARPVLHPVVRHGLPARRRGEPAAAHRPWAGRAGLLQPGRHLRLSFIG